MDGSGSQQSPHDPRPGSCSTLADPAVHAAGRRPAGRPSRPPGETDPRAAETLWTPTRMVSSGRFRIGTSSGRGPGRRPGPCGRPGTGRRARALQRRADAQWHQVRVQFPDWESAEATAAVHLAPVLEQLVTTGASAGGGSYASTHAGGYGSTTPTPQRSTGRWTAWAPPAHSSAGRRRCTSPKPPRSAGRRAYRTPTTCSAPTAATPWTTSGEPSRVFSDGTCIPSGT